MEEPLVEVMYKEVKDEEFEKIMKLKIIFETDKYILYKDGWLGDIYWKKKVK